MCNNLPASNVYKFRKLRNNCHRVKLTISCVCSMHQVNSVVALKDEYEDQRAFGDQYSLCVSVLILI